jgi:hypothetical protein
MHAPLVAKKASDQSQRSTVSVQRHNQSSTDDGELLRFHRTTPATGRAHWADEHPNELGAEDRSSAGPNSGIQRHKRHWSFANVSVFSPGERRFQMPDASHSSLLPTGDNLSIGRPDDPLEQEADSVAKQVMSRPADEANGAFTTPEICAKSAENAGKQKLQKKSTTPEASAAPDIVHQVLRSQGQPLDPQARAFMEPRFGLDFSQVRIHADAAASRSAKEINARAYTAGNNLVFASGQFSAQSPDGQILLAHELTHVVQQGGEAHVIQRAPANYPSNKPPSVQSGQKSDPVSNKSVPQLSSDDWIWVLETIRRNSPEEFVKILAANEGRIYPILKPYGFQGSWVKDQAYLNDFDAAVRKWGKSSLYRQRFPSLPKAASHQRPRSREERKYEDAKSLSDEFTKSRLQHREDINHELESAGLMDDLQSGGFEREGAHSSHVAPPYYQARALKALNKYILKYEEAHHIKVPPAPASITSGEEIDIANARAEALEYMENSPLGALLGGTAGTFTSDPRVIAGFAGFGAAVEGTGLAFVGRQSYAPDVENKPGHVLADEIIGNQPRIKPPVDPSKVGAPSAREPIPPPDKIVKDPAPIPDQAKPLATSAGGTVEPHATSAPIATPEAQPPGSISEYGSEKDEAAAFKRGAKRETVGSKRDARTRERSSERAHEGQERDYTLYQIRALRQEIVDRERAMTIAGRQHRGELDHGVPDDTVLRTINDPQVILVARNSNWVFYRNGTIVITPRQNVEYVMTAYGTGGRIPQRRLSDIQALYPGTDLRQGDPEPPIKLNDWIAQQTGPFSVFKIWP